MRIDLLGLGPSIHEYKNDGALTVGVNDIYKYYPADFIVCVDPVRVFTPERLETIKRSTPLKFITFLEEWRGLVKNFELYPLSKKGRHNPDLHNPGVLSYSILSPFTALGFAYSLGASEVTIYGVDLTNHPVLSLGAKQGNSVKYMLDMCNALKDRGVKVYVGSNKSLLSHALEVRER